MLNKIRAWWDDLNENYKRLLLTVGFTLLIILLGFLIYYLFFRPRPATLPGETPIGTTGTITPITDIREILENQGIPITEEGQIPPTTGVQLPREEVLPAVIADGSMTLAEPQVYSGAQNAVIIQTGELNYYNKDDGKFYQIGDQGNIQALSTETFPDAQKITWSPKNTQAIIEFPDGNKILYDFKEQKQSTLPKEGQDYTFSPTGDQIGYKFITNNPEENWLVVSNPTGEQAKAVEHIGSANPADVLINWSPDNSKVAMFRKSSALDQEEIVFIGQNGENYKSLSVAGRGFEALWAPKGSSLLYNVYNEASGYRPELYITNSTDDDMGVHNKSLGLRTWADKCTFAEDNTTAYCAVPLYLQQGSGIYPGLAANTADVIYKINIQTGFKQRVAIPTNALGIGLYTADKLMLAPGGKTLYMMDKNGGIYKMQLSK